MKVFLQAYLAREPLAIDETASNIVCPLCNGGVGKEKSLSITQRPDGVLYNCYRATCAEGGGFIPLVTMLAPRKKKKEFKPALYTEPLRRLNAGEARVLILKFGLRHTELAASGVKYNPKRGTYVFPINDWSWREVGCVDRAYWGRTPKAINYWYNDCVKVHWTPATAVEDNHKILLVEDMVSGIKASRFMNTVVLLGTNFNYEIATHLRQFTNHIVMALDADATGKAIKYKQKYGVMFGNFSVILLSKDLKDMSDVEIEDLLNNNG